MAEVSVNKFLANNWSVVVVVLGAIFTAGSIFSEFTALKSELSTVHERLDKKISKRRRLSELIGPVVCT